jgi:carbamoyl-phosphate synthase small subunit
MLKKALIMLENGYYEYGRAFASSGSVFAEFVFNTSMTGYEEIMSDPSYKGQAVVFTNPLIGNYGITKLDFQSSKIHTEAIVLREYSRRRSNFRSVASIQEILEEKSIIGIDRVDTRAITKEIRTIGAMQGGISTEILDPQEFLKAIKNSGSISDTDMYKLVISDKVEVFEGNQNSNKTIIAIDFGIKKNIINSLLRYYKKIYLVPFDDNIEENIKQIEFDAVFLSNGPGDPRTVNKIDELVRSFVESKIPVIAICFGHQLIGKSFGLNVIKLPFGHHGANHPVKFMDDNRVYITAQNHNYAIDEESLKNNKDWDLTWLNLFDGSVEGMRHKHLAINSVQFHPEASPGPNESNIKVFDDFYKTVCMYDQNPETI